MSKWLGEQMADAFARRRPGVVQIASFRFHLLVGPTEFGNPGFGPTLWLEDPEAAEEQAVREFFGWTGKVCASLIPRLVLAVLVSSSPFHSHGHGQTRVSA